MGRRQELARRLTTADAVIIGLGAMLGAGVFAAPGPAAAAAGTWLLAGLALASVVAYANATSSAQLAALYPESGGTYVYARQRLGDYWGFLAGWSFVVGKTASLAAMALTFGAYAHPDLARPIGIGAVVAMTVVNYRGVEKTARLTRVIVALVLAALLVVVAASLLGGRASLANLDDPAPRGIRGVLQAGGLLFFAFAGYARLATLGEEVRAPEVTIPRAIPIALGIVVAVYAAVLGSALLAVGPGTLADAPAPLASAVEGGRWSSVAPIVRVGAAIASAGVLLSLLAGISRTTLSMARRRELPRFLDAVHPVHRTPYRAEVTAAVIVCTAVLVADLRGAIGFSSFAVLTYYGLANASAWTLTEHERRWPRWLAGLGVATCALLALTLPAMAVIGGGVLLLAGSLVWLARRAGPGGRPSPTRGARPHTEGGFPARPPRTDGQWSARRGPIGQGAAGPADGHARPGCRHRSLRGDPMRHAHVRRTLAAFTAVAALALGGVACGGNEPGGDEVETTGGVTDGTTTGGLSPSPRAS